MTTNVVGLVPVQKYCFWLKLQHVAGSSFVLPSDSPDEVGRISTGVSVAGGFLQSYPWTPELTCVLTGPVGRDHLQSQLCACAVVAVVWSFLGFTAT